MFPKRQSEIATDYAGIVADEVLTPRKLGASLLDGESGILSSHLPFGDHRRGWDFRSVGRGGVDFEAVIRALNRIGYDGPLSVEWEDVGMNRVQGARESAAFVRRLDFEPAAVAFDAAFGRE